MELSQIANLTPTLDERHSGAIILEMRQEDYAWYSSTFFPDTAKWAQRFLRFHALSPSISRHGVATALFPVQVLGFPGYDGRKYIGPMYLNGLVLKEIHISGLEHIHLFVRPDTAKQWRYPNYESGFRV